MCNNFDDKLWLAELKKQEAENLLTLVSQALERTKNRATNLLGWMITLTIGLGAASFSKTNPYPLCTIVLCIGFFITACFCVSVLYSTQWLMPILYPSFIQKQVVNYDLNQIKLIEKIADHLEECIMKNSHSVIIIQARMQITWFIALLTPIFAIPLVLTLNYLIYLVYLGLLCVFGGIAQNLALHSKIFLAIGSSSKD